LASRGAPRKFPPFVDGAISRDFVCVDDVSQAYVDTPLNLREPVFGDFIQHWRR
jgi:hypothetical protein